MDGQTPPALPSLLHFAEPSQWGKEFGIVSPKRPPKTSQTFVTPAKAGVQPPRLKFPRRELD